MDQYELLKHTAEIFKRLNIPYFVTGSMASIYYGEPRLTIDIDIVVDINREHISGLLKAFSQDEFYLSEEAIQEAVKRRKQFNIIHSSSGLKIDVIVRKDNAFDDSRFNRLKKILTAENVEANFSSPEDVIIMKMKFYQEGSSEKHLRDITSMLKISSENIDKKYIESWVDKLKLNDIWKAILKKLDTK